MSTARITQLVTTEPEGFSGFRVQVPPEFETVFSHFYYAENHSPEPITKTLLPSFETIIGFNFGGPVQLTANQPSTAKNPDKNAQQKQSCPSKDGQICDSGSHKKSFQLYTPSGLRVIYSEFQARRIFPIFWADA